MLWEKSTGLFWLTFTDALELYALTDKTRLIWYADTFHFSAPSRFLKDCGCSAGTSGRTVSPSRARPLYHHRQHSQGQTYRRRGRRQCARPHQYPPDKPRGTRSTDRSARGYHPASMASDANATARKRPPHTAAQSIQNSSDVMLFSHSIKFLSIFFYLPSPKAAMPSERIMTRPPVSASRGHAHAEARPTCAETARGILLCLYGRMSD